jgi:succinate dehydrogenase/fumarate reductase flavoprotein subunit
MSDWLDIIKSGPVPEWPYPIRYDQESRVQTDVLVLGGGIAGSHAAIAARRKGVKVTVVEKGATKWSGSGGAGVDHWLAACTNPCSQVTPEEYTEQVIRSCGGYDCGALRYITCRESWDALLDCERMGLKIRDSEGEFKGAAFRDDRTELLFAYDYKNRLTMRVYGYNVKPLLYTEMKRSGVEIYDRVMVTSLLTQEVDAGNKVTGATGVNMRTGEFIIFEAKAIIIATGLPGRLWVFSTELKPAFRDFNNVGDGCAIAWKVGAGFAKMEQSFNDSGPLSYLEYGIGNAHNTWYGASIVDATGKEVPWYDRDSKELKSVAGRFQPAPGQQFWVGLGERVPSDYENQVNAIAPDLPERIKRGEFKLPLYADLSRLPEHERRAIFGLMVGNEGKTRIPVYEALTRAGFNPDNDLLQAPVMNPEGYQMSNFWAGMDVPHWRIWGSGGLVVDWDLKTDVEGLYAAGGAIFGAGAHSGAAASGRYAGRIAAAFAMTSQQAKINPDQLKREKSRVYKPLQEYKHRIGWKELNAGICRIMQDYCGQYRSEETLKIGIKLLKELGESEATRLYASTPHELGRALECYTLITVGEMTMQACLARKASSQFLNHYRLDYPSIDPVDWQKLLVIKLQNRQVNVTELPFNYHLLPPYAPAYRENYEQHCEAKHID